MPSFFIFRWRFALLFQQEPNIQILGPMSQVSIFNESNFTQGPDQLSQDEKIRFTSQAAIKEHTAVNLPELPTLAFSLAQLHLEKEGPQYVPECQRAMSGQVYLLKQYYC